MQEKKDFLGERLFSAIQQSPHIIEKNIVDTVVSGGPAHGLLKAGDAVKSVTIGEKTIVITRQFQFIEALLLVKPGEKFTILVEREGVSTPVEITLALSDFVAQE